MSEENTNISPANINTELAKQRSHEASERTMMAWIRTALSLIGFGIGIYEVAEETGGSTVFKSSKVVGLALILVGMFSSFFAMQENKINHKRLEQPVFKYEAKTPLSTYVGYALIIIAIFSSIHIIYKLLQ